MTLEEMQERAGQVAAALNASEEFSEAVYVAEDQVPGGPLPVAFQDRDGNDLVVNLDVL